LVSIRIYLLQQQCDQLIRFLYRMMTIVTIQGDLIKYLLTRYADFAVIKNRIHNYWSYIFIDCDRFGKQRIINGMILFKNATLKYVATIANAFIPDDALISEKLLQQINLYK
jgi:hypothetical protein